MAIRSIQGGEVWRVSVTLPPVKGRSWPKNETVIVVAPTADRAIACAREHCGDGTVWGVTHYAASGTPLVIDEGFLVGAQDPGSL